MIKDKLNAWIKDSRSAGNKLAAAYIVQVKAAYDANFEYFLVQGLCNMRHEVDTLDNFNKWDEFYKETYNPNNIIRNLAEIYSWRTQEEVIND